MKVTTIELQSTDRTLLSVGTANVSTSDKYLMRGVFGLDADQVVPKYYGSGAVTGTKWYSFSRKKREVTLRVVLNPNYLLKESFSDIRDDLYRAISGNRSGQLDLVFLNGGSAVSKLSGFITKFEVPYSSDAPELQITMEFKDPILRSLGQVVYETAAIATTNPILVANSDSTAPTGFCFQVTFTAASADFIIWDKASSPDAIFSVTPDTSFQIGDKLFFSSEHNDKQLYVDRSSTIIPMVDHIDEGSVWPILFPGINEFYVFDQADFDWDFIKFYKAYWGL